MRLFCLMAFLSACAVFAQLDGPDIIGPQPDYAATDIKAEPWPQFHNDAFFAPATGVNVVVTVSALLPAWPFEAPISVTIADSAGQVVAQHHEITELHARHLVEVKRALAPGTYQVTARIDPHNVINEISETNNSVSTRVEISDEIPPAVDLHPLGDQIRVQSLEVTTVPENKGGQAIIDATVAQALSGESWYYDHVIRPPDATTDADLLVELLIQPGQDDESIAVAAKALAGLWFIDSVDIRPEEVVPTPRPLPGTDPITDLLGIAAVSPIIVAPEVITLALTYSLTDEARSYWQVSVPVVQDGRGPMPLIAIFPPDPVSVRFKAMTADGAAAIFDTTVRPGLPGQAIAEGFLPQAASGHIKGLITVDPDNAIAEFDEDNNSAEFTTEPPPPEDDLSPHCDRAHSRSVTATADPNNPVLLELVRRTGLQTLGDNHAPLFLNVFPWHNNIPGVLDFVRPDTELDFDLLVVAPVLDIVARGSDTVRQALVETYAMQWYAEDVVALDSLPFWAELQTVDILPQYPLVIGIKLTDAEIAVQYRRVSLPVEYNHDAIPLPTNRFDSTLPYFDDSIARLAPPIAVEFSYGVAREGAVRDYLSFEFGVRRATAFLLEAEPETPVKVYVDPFNIIDERDEENNGCEIRNEVEPPVGSLHAKAELSADGQALQVTATFSNPTEQAITLRFTSGLELDFTVNDSYRWSDDKFFTQALSEVTIAPGAEETWTLRESTAITQAAVGPAEVWHIVAELADYRAETKIRPPTPGIEPPDPGLPPFPDPDDIIDLIVGPDGLDFSLFGDDFEIIKPPDGGDLFNDFQLPNDFHYMPGTHFGGVDFITFQVDDRKIMRRLKVGPQEHEIELDEGWNLVSFPTRPFEKVKELIARIPDGKAWDFRRGDYRELRNIAVGRGIWLYAGEATTLSYLGEPIGEPRVDLSEGWNIVGAVNPDAIPDDPRILAIYDFDGAGFKDASELRTGDGYWLYASRPFSLPLR